MLARLQLQLLIPCQRRLTAALISVNTSGMPPTRRKASASPPHSSSRRSGNKAVNSDKRRKSSSRSERNERSVRQSAQSHSQPQSQPQSHDEEEANAHQGRTYEPVLRQFYPPEIDNARCQSYLHGPRSRPIEVLESAVHDHSEMISNAPVQRAVVHWFKSDLRLGDNRALHKAYQLANRHQVPLICLYILSPEDLTAHLSSPARVDLILRTLGKLQRDLDALNIPLYMETQETRARIPHRIVDLCQGRGASHIFANIEYEVDELRRDAQLIRTCAANGVAFQTVRDSCVVTPGQLESKQGKQYSVFSPWYKSWVTHLYKNPDELRVLDKPGRNAGNARETFADMFHQALPNTPENKQLSGQQQRNHLRQLYPEGEDAALNRLDTFLRDKARAYAGMRDYPTGETTSILSPYFSCGALSARTAVCRARDANNGELEDDGNGNGYASWIREVAFRDFYKHVLVHWPYVCMNKPFKLEFTALEWTADPDSALFAAWCVGRTGYPIVDAAMRALNTDAWLHNRLRMLVASFLAKHLLLDWRRGERYFMEHLVDGDFASNNGGWGFGSSTGVDAQPYFRIFSPLRQSEKFDADGDFIRQWVPELRGIQGKAVHDPYGRGEGEEAERNGYPRMIVDHEEARKRALDAYKAAAQGK